MTTLALAAAAATFCALLLLAWRHPARSKAARQRSAGAGPGRWTPRQRRILAVAAVAPGVSLAVLGAWAELTIWLALLSLCGWLTSRMLPGGR